MEPNEPLNAAPQPDAAPVTTQSPAATQERPAEKPRAAVRVTQQFVVRMQRGQNEAALPPKGGKPPLRATYNAVGQLLYRVGTQAEYTCIRLGRGIRGAFRLALRAAAALYLSRHEIDAPARFDVAEVYTDEQTRIIRLEYLADAFQ